MEEPAIIIANLREACRHAEVSVVRAEAIAAVSVAVVNNSRGVRQETRLVRQFVASQRARRIAAKTVINPIVRSDTGNRGESALEKQEGADVLIGLTRSNTVEEWKQAILSLLEREDNKQCTLLSLMTVAKLQSRSVKHPFNDALTALIHDKRVLWSDLPGSPIRIVVL